MEEFLEIGTFFDETVEAQESCHLYSALFISYFCHKYTIHKEKIWYETFLKRFDLPDYSQVRQLFVDLSDEDKK